MSVNAFGGTSTKPSSSSSSTSLSGITTTQLNGTFLRLDGNNKMTNNIDANGKKIPNLATPTSSADAVTKPYVDTQSASKLNFAGGTLTGSLTIGGGTLTVSDGNILMGSGHEVITDRNPSSSDALYRKGYVDAQDSYKLSVSGGSMTGNLTMSGSTEVIQATAPTTANSLCNKTYVDKMLPLSGGSMTGNILMSGLSEIIAPAPTTNYSLTNRDYVDNAVAGKVSNTGGSMTGNLTLTNSAEVVVSQAPTTASSLCNKTYVDNLYTTGSKASDMLVNIGSSDSRTLGCIGVTARPTQTGYVKKVALNFGNADLSSITSYIGTNPQYSSLSIMSPGKVSFSNYASNDTIPIETAKIEAAVIGSVTKGLLTMNGNISLGFNNANKITNSADPADANGLANKNYVGTMIPVFKTATGTLGNSSSDTILLQCTSAKSPQNGKIYVGKAWIERGVGEWFSCETYYVSSVFGGSFQFFYRASTMRVTAYFGTKPTGWTCNYRLDYLEFP